jgi:hypothetical protein
MPEELIFLPRGQRLETPTWAMRPAHPRRPQGHVLVTRQLSNMPVGFLEPGQTLSHAPGAPPHSWLLFPMTRGPLRRESLEPAREVERMLGIPAAMAGPWASHPCTRTPNRKVEEMTPRRGGRKPGPLGAHDKPRVGAAGPDGLHAS